MGLLDHRKTWRFTLVAPPDRCVAAFISAFDGSRSGPVLSRAKWDVGRKGQGAVASYKGRSGLIKGVTLLSSRASSEEDAALGSEITFKTERDAEGRTVCSMWLSSRGTALGFTADGRFFRPYMRMVQDALAELDPALLVQTS